jgi:hypothetical protein
MDPNPCTVEAVYRLGQHTRQRVIQHQIHMLIGMRFLSIPTQPKNKIMKPSGYKELEHTHPINHPSNLWLQTRF